MGTQKIIVFTDIHITAEPQGGQDDPVVRLRAGLDRALAVMPDADLLLITGDLTHHGDEASYRRLKLLVDALPLPVALMLGNHDDRAAFRRVFPGAPVDADGFVQRVVRLGGTRLITLDTLTVHHEGSDFTHAGELCDRRLAWLDAKLSEAGDAPCIVAMHHPSHDIGFASMDSIKLRDGGAFDDLIARHGNVRHIFAGHVHRTISGTHRGTPFSILKSTVAQMPLMFEGTDTSVECDEPPAFGMVFVRENGLTVHTEDFKVL